MITYTKELGEDVARHGKILYEERIRAAVETPENIGKMLLIDVDTGDYKMDSNGIDVAQHLHAKRTDALLYRLRIGYNVADTIGGFMERTA